MAYRRPRGINSADPSGTRDFFDRGQGALDIQIPGSDAGTVDDHAVFIQHEQTNRPRGIGKIGFIFDITEKYRYIQPEIKLQTSAISARSSIVVGWLWMISASRLTLICQPSSGWASLM